MALLAACSLQKAAAAPGDLDPTFGSFGVAGTPLEIADIRMQSDGKLVVAGIARSPNGQSFAVARLQRSGAADATFNGGGIAVAPLGRYAAASVLAIQSDGKILAAGVAEGVLDAGFDHFVGIVTRYDADGGPDSSFGHEGIVTFNVFSPASDEYTVTSVTGLAILADGRIVATGFASSASTPIKAFLFRLNRDGSPDRSFGDAGLVFVPESFALEPPYAGPLVHEGGRLVLAGTSFALPFFGGGVALRFDTNGKVDGTFGVGGAAGLPFAPSALLALPDGRMVVSATQAGIPTLSIARINADGSSDRSFGNNGLRTTVVGDCPRAVSSRIDPCPRGPSALALQADGKVLQTGNTFDGVESLTVVARYDGDGSMDPTFGMQGLAFSRAGRSGVAAAIDHSIERLYAGGDSDDVARYSLTSGPVVVLQSTANPSNAGAVTLEATVDGQTPSGTVRFGEDGVAVAGCEDVPLGNLTASSAVASCSVTLQEGTHWIVAGYEGNVTNAPGMSGPYVQSVGTTPRSRVIEYSSAQLGDYFVTSIQGEIAALDSGVTPGWQRTGESFAGLADGSPHSKMMCRFFSEESYAPKSSHFFGISTADCSIGGPWHFEGDVIAVAMPAIDGTCPDGTRPLYRLYNAGQGGVPHHRLTPVVATRAAMLAQGWVPEGRGMGVAACVQ
jgi:uncharacterized delta-60 repeat protein